MRKKREPESDQQRSDRADRHDREKIEQDSAEDRAIDAAIKNSIKQHGP